MTDQPMSQWPSEWEYVLPVRPGPDQVTITVVRVRTLRT